MFNLLPVRRRGNGSGETFGFPLARLHDEFETIFNRFFGGWPLPMGKLAYPETSWGFDVEDADKEYLIRAEAPGFETKEIEVEVADNVLTVRAEHKEEEKKEKGGAQGFAERRLERSMTLPAGVEPDKIEAAYKNGILEVHVPKSEKVKPRRIAVKA